jgi:hypothetical protein
LIIRYTDVGRCLFPLGRKECNQPFNLMDEKTI